MLRGFARGQDATEVKPYDRDAADVMREIKSYGNGLTAPRDICDPQSAKAYVWMLAESVAQRMREGRVIQYRVTLVEGWTFRQMRAAMARDEFLKQDTVLF